MSRILAIDYGQKRTGIAVTDTLQMIANGLTTVDTRELEKFIVDYMAQEDVSTIVVVRPSTSGLLNSMVCPAMSTSNSSVSALTGRFMRATGSIPAIILPWTSKDIERFDKYLAGQLAKISIPNKDEAFLTERMLTMYANPVRNYLKAKV